MLRVLCNVGLLLCGTGLLGSCASMLPGTAVATLPQIIAHRGGGADAPENTLVAVRQAIHYRVDAIWLSVQLSKDGVPVLYRPADLSALTDSSGPVSDHTAAELAHINAGWTFHQPGTPNAFPYRDHPVGIPTLREALLLIPPDMPIMLDMKALPAEPQAAAIAQVLTETKAWSRVVIYSTQVAYQHSFAAHPQAQLFESRDATRLRLMRVLLGEGCVDAPTTPTWVGFELHRKLTVTEKFTLGKGYSEVNATLWTPQSVACFRRPSKHVSIMAIAVNDAVDYQTATCVGVDAVLADSPREMTRVRARLAQSLPCPEQTEIAVK